MVSNAAVIVSGANIGGYLVLVLDFATLVFVLTAQVVGAPEPGAVTDVGRATFRLKYGVLRAKKKTAFRLFKVAISKATIVANSSIPFVGDCKSMQGIKLLLVFKKQK